MHYFSTLLLAIVVAITSLFGSDPIQADPGDQLFKLLPGDRSWRSDFGQSMAMDNGFIAIGAHLDRENGYFSGAAYLFDASTGDLISKLMAPDGRKGDMFGFSIAIGNGIVAVGANRDDDNGDRSGSAYTFDASSGTPIAKLRASDGAADDEFGYSIAIDDGIVAIGAVYDGDKGRRSGAAYLFDAITGVQLAKLVPDDGVEDDLFGSSIAIDNGVVAVGAPHDDDHGDASGSAYLFSASTGIQLAKLLPTDGIVLAKFGTAIAIDQDVVAVGAPLDNSNGRRSGSAYLFDVSTGTQLVKIFPDEGAEDDWFGFSIAIDSSVVAVGALGDGNQGTSTGAAYLFDRFSGAQIANLLPSDGAEKDLFGCSIAVDNGVVSVGALGGDGNGRGKGTGSAYLFTTGDVESCLELSLDNLVAGERAIFVISGGTPGAKAITVCGIKPGQTSIYDIAGYCASFGIRSVKQRSLIGGSNRSFESNGEINFRLNVPIQFVGLTILLQSAQQSNCPDECTSNLINAVIQ